ncbi:MAG TPA: PEP-utilizing enzyme, partial [archaeon]|nr:PEP-utilizing enzyme [archaeon]
DYGSVRPGEILVTSKAAPEIELLRRDIAGIVTDVGGRCSHAMNFAREYGVPAIVATGNATEALKDGMLVRVDSDKGVVEIIG